TSGSLCRATSWLLIHYSSNPVSEPNSNRHSFRLRQNSSDSTKMKKFNFISPQIARPTAVFQDCVAGQWLSDENLERALLQMGGIARVIFKLGPKNRKNIYQSNQNCSLLYFNLKKALVR
ncbi:MAG: hypothetical protein MHPSP_002157, partial [Paramarteilia canceri]